jgi:hypothetical protein
MSWLLVLVGTIGGLGSILSYIGFEQIRNWQRISIFITFSCIAVSCYVIQFLTRNLSKVLQVSVCALLLLLGVLDQVGGSAPFTKATDTEEFILSKKFLRDIENVMPNASAIYNLPYVEYPETIAPGTMQTYHHSLGLIGSNSIEIHLPPEYFYPEIFELQHEMITSRGGKKLYVETSHFIDIESWAPGTMSKGNKKKLRQCVENFVTTVELSIAELGTVYELIMNNRLSRGVSLSISLSQLRTSFLQMPKSYRCYGTFLGSEMIAAAVTVLITDDFEYVYMWADDVNHRSLSPVVTLCEALVADSRSRGVRTLDLGISSKHGVLDEGLSRFKLNLGALTGTKISYTV